MTDRTPEPQTADLVKRLREDAEMWDAILGPGASITREAADAIEELTAALRAIRNRAAETAPTHATRDIVKWCDHAISKYKASNG